MEFRVEGVAGGGHADQDLPTVRTVALSTDGPGALQIVQDPRHARRGDPERLGDRPLGHRGPGEDRMERHVMTEPEPADDGRATDPTGPASDRPPQLLERRVLQLLPAGSGIRHVGGKDAGQIM